MDRRIFLAGCSAGSFAVALTWPAWPVLAIAASDDPLLEGFRNPPPGARPQTWWHWMNGNVTADGITRDLEAIAHVGIGGVQMFDVGCGIPAGSATPLSPEWVKLVRHAADECGRLGLSFTVHNCPGWSSSGGPWITPELSMQQLVWSEITLDGGTMIDRTLPQPLTRLGYYRDAMLIAFPALPGDRPAARGQIVRATLNGGPADIRVLTDADAATAIEVTPAKGAPAQLLVAFAEPYRARSLTMQAIPPDDAPNFALGSSFILEASDDGTRFRPVAEIPVPNWRLRAIPPIIGSFPETAARFFRLNVPAQLRIAELSLSREPRIPGIGDKGGWGRWPDQGEATSDAGEATGIDPATVIDLGRFVDADGHLRWPAPAGTWTIARFGHTSSGARNVSAPEGGAGLECDKFSAAALDFHFDRYFGQLLPSLERLGQRGLAGSVIDSYETGMQNWTADFPREFQARRGYAILPYMPVLTGRVVGSPDISERFLWDLRRVQALLMEERYYGRFHQLCRQHGLVSFTEPYGNGPFDEQRAGAQVDRLMGEFWARGGAAAYSVKVAATTAHVYGKTFVGAESFTGRPAQARWLGHPYAFKALGDEMYSLGLTHFVFHRYAQQPHPTARPGMTMGPWGSHFERTNTWYAQAGPWLAYATRCQHLLSQGRFVADILYFAGESSPVQTPVHIEEPVAATLLGARPKLSLPVPPGHDYDVANAEVLLTRAAIRDGEIVLPDGIRYRVLVMPEDLRVTRELLEKLRDCVAAGMWLAGPRVAHSHGLGGYPESDAEVRRIADDLWGDLDGTSRRSRAYGKGRVFWGMPLRDVLDAAGRLPDVEISARSGDATIHWIHRRIDDADLYFLANGRRRPEEIIATFRIAGRRPERWDPMTGAVTPLPIYGPADHRTRVALTLNESGSCFVVFRAPADGKTAAPQPYAAARAADAAGDFTITAWIKPETDLWPISPEIASSSTQPDIVAARAAAFARSGGSAKLGVSGASFIIDPPPGEALFGPGHAVLAISAGRNGVILYGHSSDAYPALLAAPVPIAGWTHLAVTSQNSVPTLYLNGRQIATGDRSQVRLHAALGLSVPRPRLFEGDLAALTLHPAPLSPAEIAQMASQELPATDGPPAIELAATEPGLLVWRNGDHAFAGRRLAGRDIGPPAEVSGPWQVSFPPGLGAPASVTLERLRSLRLHEDFGVRHFSGTATYRAQFSIAPASLGGGRRVFLDLGRVEVMAAVRVNGRDLEAMWKPPFRVDVTEAVRPGPNILDVSVTNLWPNRLIGDEHFPADSSYEVSAFDATGGITALPQWYREGRPMPPGQRVAFTTWKHYGAGDPLLESGLLGPVRLFQARFVPLPT